MKLESSKYNNRHMHNYNYLTPNPNNIVLGKRQFSTTRIVYNSILPIPLFKIKHLSIESLKENKELLSNKGGIYCIINNIDTKRYIGSAKDFYLRLTEHLNNKKSNLVMQKSIKKYGMENFSLYIYEYFTYEDKMISHKKLIELETSYIKKFNIDNLYNYTLSAESLEGYKHTEETKSKMKKRYSDITKHPMYGKNHTEDSLKRISKPGKLNPMYGKTHGCHTKSIMSKRKNKYPLGIGIYDKDNNFISKYENTVKLADYFGVSKVTVSKYVNSGKLYKNTFYLKPIK